MCLQPAKQREADKKELQELPLSLWLNQQLLSSLLLNMNITVDNI